MLMILDLSFWINGVRCGKEGSIWEATYSCSWS